MRKNKILSLVLALVMILSPLGDMVWAAEEETDKVTITYQVDKNEGYFEQDKDKEKVYEIVVELKKDTTITDELVKEKAPKVNAEDDYKFLDTWEKVDGKTNTYKAKMTKLYGDIVYKIDSKEGYFDAGTAQAQELKIDLGKKEELTDELVKKKAPEVKAKEGYKFSGNWKLVSENIYKAEMTPIVKYDRIIYTVDSKEGYFDVGGSAHAQEVKVDLDKKEELTDELVKKHAPKLTVKEGFKFLDTWTNEKENTYKAKIEKIKTEDVTYLIDPTGGYFLKDGDKLDKITLKFEEDTIITDSLVKEKAPKAYVNDNYKIVGDWEKETGLTNTYRLKVEKIGDLDIVYRVDFTKAYISLSGQEKDIFIEQVASGVTIDDKLVKKLAPKVVARKGYEITDEWEKVKGIKNTYELKINTLEDKKITYKIDFDKGYFMFDDKEVSIAVDYVAPGVEIDDTVIKNLAPKAYARSGYELVEGWKKVEGEEYTYVKELKKISKPSKVTMYSIGANIRDLNNRVIGYLFTGDKVEGEIRGSYLYFYLDGELVKAHTAFLKYSPTPAKLYVKSGSNIREDQGIGSAKVDYYKKGRIVYGINRGAWTELKQNGKKVYIASNRLSKTPVPKIFVSKGVRVRDSVGIERGYYEPGFIFEGFEHDYLIMLNIDQKWTVHKHFVREY